MELANKKELHDAISELVEVRQISAMIGQAFTAPLKRGDITFDGYKLEEQAENFKNHVNKKYGYAMTKDEAILTIIVSQMLKNPEVDSSIFAGGLTNELIENGKVFHMGELEKKPFIQDVKIRDLAKGEFKLTKTSCKKYGLMHYDMPKVHELGFAIPKIAVCDHTFDYPCIMKGESIYRAASPKDMITADKALSEAEGSVLCAGLGVGYAAFSLAANEKVNSITVVEKEQDIIDIFKENILPQTPNGDKISFICDDPIAFLSNGEDGRYDFIYADLWKDDRDAYNFLKAKEALRKYKETKVSLRLEEEIVFALVGYIVMAMVEEGHRHTENEMPPLQIKSEEEQYKLACMRSLIDGVSVEEPEQIKWFGDYRNIMKLL